MTGSREARLATVSPARAPRLRVRGPSAVWLVGAVGLLASACLVGLAVGPVDVGLGGIVRALADRAPFVHVESSLTPTEDTIVFDLRLPRVALAALVGGMLAVAGAAFQGAFRNPLADPYLLGAAAGAALGVTLTVSYLPAGAVGSFLPVAAFAGAATAVVVAYLLGRSVSGRSAVSLLLAGVVVASFFTALQTFVQQQNVETVQEVYSWLLGRLTTAGWHDVLVVLPYAALSTLILLVHRRALDVLSVGDEEASALGLDVRRVRLVVIAGATLATAAAVAVSGLIGFVGIIVPHTLRLLAGGSYRVLLPLSLICGGAFLVLADVVARTVLAPGELPIGVVTAFFGAPFFAVVLRRSRIVAT